MALPSVGLASESRRLGLPSLRLVTCASRRGHVTERSRRMTADLLDGDARAARASERQQLLHGRHELHGRHGRHAPHRHVRGSTPPNCGCHILDAADLFDGGGSTARHGRHELHVRHAQHVRLVQLRSRLAPHHHMRDDAAPHCIGAHGVHDATRAFWARSRGARQYRTRI
jgi:hypothetical protein